MSVGELPCILRHGHNRPLIRPSAAISPLSLTEHQLGLPCTSRLVLLATVLTSYLRKLCRIETVKGEMIVTKKKKRRGKRGIRKGKKQVRRWTNVQQSRR